MNEQGGGPKIKFQFERKLSLDGVAIIIGVIGAFIWIGQLKENIGELNKQSQSQADQLVNVGKDVNGVKSDVAVLRVIVEERTQKSVK